MDSIQLNNDSRRSSSTAERIREPARALRRAGHSFREIKEILGISSNQTLNKALRGEPPPEWTRRPRAKDDLHAQARELRATGLNYKEIAAALGVSKSSVSLWVRDIPRPERLSYEECCKRSAEGARLYWETERSAREAEREGVRTAAADQIGELSQREVLVAGAIAYWCEGSKSKPHQLREQVVFINSDPGLIKFFLRFLASAGVQPTLIHFRVYIHETADVAAAEQFWADVTNSGPDAFYKAVLKRHNAKTVRRNVDADYRGCLRIDVMQSADLYRRIEGWARAAMKVAS
jgi:transcriptional regulator with XRE-family HTH domain